MDTAVASLLGAGVGALAGLSGTVVAQVLQGRREHKRWLIQKKEEAYSNCLRYLLKALNRRSRISGEGGTYLTQEDIPNFFGDLIEAQAWLTAVSIYCADQQRHVVVRASSSVNEAISEFVSGSRAMGRLADERPTLPGAIQEAYTEIVKCARDDLGKHIT